MMYQAEFSARDRRDYILPVTSQSADYHDQVDSLQPEIDQVLNFVLSDLYPVFWTQLRVRVLYRRMDDETDNFWYYLPRAFVNERADISSFHTSTAEALKSRIEQQELRGSGWLFQRITEAVLGVYR